MIEDAKARLVEIDEGFHFPGRHAWNFGRGGKTTAMLWNEKDVKHLRAIANCPDTCRYASAG